jgi:hypothetical protein
MDAFLVVSCCSDAQQSWLVVEAALGNTSVFHEPCISISTDMDAFLVVSSCVDAKTAKLVRRCSNYDQLLLVDCNLSDSAINLQQ